MLKKIVLTACMLYAVLSVTAQVNTNTGILKKASGEYRQKELQNLEKAVGLAKEKGWLLSYKTSNGNIALLVGVDDAGYPIYYTTENNIVAAATTRANVLWPGGSSGLNLTGSSPNLAEKIAVWDGGRVFADHLELIGRVLQKDNPAGFSDHATHVAGTMIAKGVNPLAKGMAYEAKKLVAYDFSFDISEMMNEAPNLLLSNHSYGTVSGWTYTGTRWEFRGRFGENEDYKFGLYNDQSMMFDSIAYNAPYYLIVKSSGNNRSENGPPVGQPYWRYDANGNMVAAGNRPAGISNNDGFDIVSTYGTAKNILTVGAINGLPYGYSQPSEVGMSTFSSWGPTDDGRIKPDVVANGVDVMSPIAASNNSYASYSGTSMATPNTTGSLLLLQEYYSQVHGGTFMRSATLKALAIHTTDEAGTSEGPDYRYGWGLLNVGKAAEVIRSNNAGAHRIEENILNNQATYTFNVVASGKGPLVGTIVWTDPKAQSSSLLNDQNPKLINDLDIRISQGTTIYRPWILDPANPASLATTGDNIRDNVERININNATPGQVYTVTVTHKGTLQRGSQAYSLILSGVGGQEYCESAPTSSAGARIDSVGFGSISNVTAAGCVGIYSNYTQYATSVQPGQTLPISVKISSCDATTAPKMVKVFIDYNNNGNFTDAGEQVAVSSASIVSGIFTANVTIPSSVTVGNATIMRVIVQETSNANDILPCGNYANGETHDYKINFSGPANDLSLYELVAPANNACRNNSQMVTIRVKNSGTVAKSNVPLTVVIRNSSGTVISTLNSTYPATIEPGAVITYSFPNTFSAAAGTTYSFEVITSETSDQNRTNDTLKTNITIAALPPAPEGLAEICGDVAILKVNNPTAGVNYFWYSSPSSTNAIAYGSSTTSTTIPANNTYYVSSGARGTVGLPAKSAYPNGGGYITSNASNFMKYNATVPVILESAKLYIKYPGKIEFIVADITNQTPTSFSYIALSTTVIDVHATSPSPAPGTQNVYDAADPGADFNLNLFLPSGEHAIIIKPIGSTNIFRNNNVTGNPYPFTLDNIISFTGNSAMLAGNPDYYQGFYYYLYNMKVRTTDCVSDRTPVVAPVIPTPTITLVGDSLVSSIDTGNQWQVNGLNVSGGNTKSIKPLQSGTYTVSVSGTLGCTRTSTGFVYIMTAVDPVTATPALEMSISPNPSNGNFTLKFKTDKKEDLRIDILNAQGQVVHTKAYPKFIGSLTEQFRLTQLSAGVYVVKVQHGNKFYYNKIVID